MNDYKLKGLICLYNCGKLVVDPENRDRNHHEWFGSLELAAFQYIRLLWFSIYLITALFFNVGASLFVLHFVTRFALRCLIGLFLGFMLRSRSRSDFCNCAALLELL